MPKRNDALLLHKGWARIEDGRLVWNLTDEQRYAELMAHGNVVCESDGRRVLNLTSEGAQLMRWYHECQEKGAMLRAAEDLANA